MLNEIYQLVCQEERWERKTAGVPAIQDPRGQVAPEVEDVRRQGANGAAGQEGLERLAPGDGEGAEREPARVPAADTKVSKYVLSYIDTLEATQSIRPSSLRPSPSTRVCTRGRYAASSGGATTPRGREPRGVGHREGGRQDVRDGAQVYSIIWKSTACSARRRHKSPAGGAFALRWRGLMRCPFGLMRGSPSRPCRGSLRGFAPWKGWLRWPCWDASRRRATSARDGCGRSTSTRGGSWFVWNRTRDSWATRVLVLATWWERASMSASGTLRERLS